MTHKIFIESPIIDAEEENTRRLNAVINRKKAEARHMKPVIIAREY